MQVAFPFVSNVKFMGGQPSRPATGDSSGGSSGSSGTSGSGSSGTGSRGNGERNA